MPADQSDSDALLETIRSKRRELAAYLGKTEPRQLRLVNISIVLGALAAALTAGPGVGGKEFIEAVKGMVPFGIPVWQSLCLLATILSVTTVILNGMLKSHDLSSRVAIARSCDAKLEGLATMLKLGQVDVKQAAPLYAQYLTEISHV